MSDVEIIGTPERTVTRRKFIMGVIATGATTSSVGYLFKGPQPLLGALSVQGSVERLVTLNVNGQQTSMFRVAEGPPGHARSHYVRVGPGFRLPCLGAKPQNVAER